AAANFAEFVPRAGSWGISLSRPKYNIRANWTCRARARGSATATGLSIEPNTYTWFASDMGLDLEGEYRLTRQFAVFANLRNVQDKRKDEQIWNPLTPSYARFSVGRQYGSLWTFGVRATF